METINRVNNSLSNLSAHYSLTYLSISDLYTHEILILLIYSIMIIFSFFTNSIAIIIFFLGRRSRSELTPFLLNLSIFNIIMTVYCIPFTITSVIFQRWLFARQLCNVLDSLKMFSVSGVLLTLIAIAIDRYCVVRHPLTIKAYQEKRRTLFAISLIWFLSITLAIVSLPARSSPVSEQRLWVSSRNLFQNYLSTLEFWNETNASQVFLDQIKFELVPTIQCVPNKIERPVEVRRTIFNFLQTYFVPLFILAFVYLRIAAMLWERTTKSTIDERENVQNHLFTSESIQFKKKLKQGIKMLVAVVVLYAILWLPMNVFQLFFNLFCYQSSTEQRFCREPMLIQLLYIAAHFLTVSNTAINPIIYGFMNNCFRSDVRQLRRRLINCQIRTHVFIPGRATRRTARDYQTRFHYAKGKAQVINNAHLRVNCPGPINQSLFLFETPNTARTPITAPLTQSDRFNKQRNTN